jgi:hypothetical protein
MQIENRDATLLTEFAGATNKIGEIVPMSERLKARPRQHIDVVEKVRDDAGIPQGR